MQDVRQPKVTETQGVEQWEPKGKDAWKETEL